MNECIHFAHANGFPAGSYRQVFNALPANIQIIAKDKFVHDTAYPLVDNWLHQVTELTDYVQANSEQPVVAVGHSFGAVISYLACCQRPDLFKGLIMLDPPLFTGAAEPLFRLLKKTKWIDRLTPAGITMGRKSRWRSEQNLVDYFASKGLFKDMDRRCIHDYVESATENTAEWRSLHFDVPTEAQVFRTIPTNLSNYTGQLTTPAVLLTGAHTKVCMPLMRRAFLRANPQIQYQTLDFGGHMFPLEQPERTAQVIDHWLRKLLVTNTTPRSDTLKPRALS